METSIVENTLTDGSKTYDVVFVDGCHRVVIAAITQMHAELIQQTLADFAISGEVH